MDAMGGNKSQNLAKYDKYFSDWRRQGAMRHSPINLENGPYKSVKNDKKWPIQNFKIIEKKLKMAHLAKTSSRSLVFYVTAFTVAYTC